jgi:hypothetical protein
MELISRAVWVALAALALTACSAKILVFEEESTSGLGGNDLGGSDLGGFAQGAASSSSSSTSSSSTSSTSSSSTSSSSTSSSSTSSSSSSGGVGPIEQACQSLCAEGCAYFGYDCINGCVGTQLSADCSEPYLGFLQCLAECVPTELCSDAFEPFHACVDPYQCNQSSDFVAEGNFCSVALACEDNHDAAMSCTSEPGSGVEQCDCFFDGEYKGSCVNAEYTQCSWLFPCCQPLWRP